MLNRAPLEAMKRIFNEKANLQRWLDVEASLSRAEAAVGIIPREAAEEISAKAKVELIDEEYRKQELERIGHKMTATIHAFQRACQGDAGEYIHWGSTSQDIMDTADQMAMKQAHSIIFESLRKIEENLLEIAEHEADTIMAGRSYGQHALPLTFGFKVAVWIREIRRHIERLKESRKRLFVGQFAGVVGTYASFGERGPEIEAMVLSELGLGIPDICWHSSRDRSAEFACIVAMIAATLGKIASEIYFLQHTEVAEVEEPIAAGRVGSSTMPHKRNPHICEFSVTLAKRIKYFAALAIEGMFVEHERGGAGWNVQRDTLGEMCILTGELLGRMDMVTKGLVVHSDAMRRNLNILKGLILSESVMLELGQSVGRQTAHEMVYRASMKTYREGISFKEALMKYSDIAEHLNKVQIDNLLNPANYVGLAPKIARKVVALTRKEHEDDLK
ncbi:adenylosuccinate lyase [Chloroflexota bacterium]